MGIKIFEFEWLFTAGVNYSLITNEMQNLVLKDLIMHSTNNITYDTSLITRLRDSIATTFNGTIELKELFKKIENEVVFNLTASNVADRIKIFFICEG